MLITVQPPTLRSQACLPSSQQIAVSPDQSTLTVAPMPSQLSGGDVVNLMIAISVLVRVILSKPTQPKQ